VDTSIKSVIVGNQSKPSQSLVKLSLVPFFLLLISGASLASAPVQEQVRNALEDDLYPFTTIVPGYQRPATNPAKIAVAEFRVSDDKLVNWSQAISEIIRYRIQYIPDSRLYMPAPFQIYSDANIKTGSAQPLLTSRSAFQNLNHSLGIETVLTGSVELNGKQFTLTTELVNLESDNITLQKEWTFTSQQLPDVLIKISQWVDDTLGVKLTKQQQSYLSNAKTLNAQAIQDFISLHAELKELKGPLRRDKINPLQQQYPDFLMFAIYALNNRVYARNLDDAYTNLELYKKLRSLFHGNAGLELESYRAMEIETLPKHKVTERLNGLKTLIKNNPHDPVFMIVYADGLINNGNSIDGLATLLEVIDRWPNHYRAWWSLGWGLNKHAWQIRGNSMWRDVPKLAKKQFSALSLLANLAIDEALTLNPNSAQLWNLKIRTLGATDGYSVELMRAFEKAAELSPSTKQIYSNALNFAGENWRGPAEARRHIIELAIQNNPDKSWPQKFKQRHISDFELPELKPDATEIDRLLMELINHPDAWKLLIIIIGAFTWFVYVLGKKSATTKAVNFENKPNVD